MLGAIMVEGSHEWLEGDWLLAKTIPRSEIDRFVTSPGISWPHDVNRYLVGVVDSPDSDGEPERRRRGSQ